MPTAKRVGDYHRDGFLRLNGGFAASEIASWQAECDRLWSDMTPVQDAERIQFRGNMSGARIADRIDPVLDVSPLFATLAADNRIVATASELFDDTAMLLKAKLITKRPETMGYLAHQDHPYWAHLGIAADDMMSVQVSIDPANVENGALEVFPSRHHDRLPAPADSPLDLDESVLDSAAWQVVTSAAGDLLFFHSLVPHRSGPNRAHFSRRTLYLTYAAGVDADIYEVYHASKAGRG